MQKEYKITGMTCSGCLAKVTRMINSLKEVKGASIQLEYPQATIQTAEPFDLEEVNRLLKKVGNYTISEELIEDKSLAISSIEMENLPKKSISAYKPLIIIVSFLIGATILSQYPMTDFSFHLWMRHFMAGFFLVFSFFKFLNLQGFAQSYGMYDVIAANWKLWGFIYPFVELALGIAYLINFAPLTTNLTTVVVLGVSSIGVIESNLNKRKIKCACLGDMFNLPMSTVTIIEDLTMVAMAIWMVI